MLKGGEKLRAGCSEGEDQTSSPRLHRCRSSSWETRLLAPGADEARSCLTGGVVGVEDDEGRGRRTVLSFLVLESALTVLTSIQTHKYVET